MKIVIIIVNYRTAELTASCVGSLAADEWVREQGRVVVVDNASGDGSAERLAALESELGAWMRVIVSERNGGFAAGNNAAIREVMGGGEVPEFVMLLNPDTVVEAGAVRALAEFMEAREEVGIAGSRLVDEMGREQCAAHRFPSPLGELEGMMRVGVVSRMLERWRVSPGVGGEARACDWVSGAALVARREMVEEVGLLDEGYFLYFEEVDWCRRAKRAGWEVWHVPRAVVRHLEGSSTGWRGDGRRAGYWYASRRRYFRRAWGWMGWAAADVCWALGWMGFQVKRRLRRGAGNDPKGYAWDLLMGDLRAMGGRDE